MTAETGSSIWARIRRSEGSARFPGSPGARRWLWFISGLAAAATIAMAAEAELRPEHKIDGGGLELESELARGGINAGLT